MKNHDVSAAQREMIVHLNIVTEFARNYPARDRGEVDTPVPGEM